MPLRNVPITYTLDQQRQEINALAADVNGLDVTFDEKVDDRVAALLQGGVGTAVTYDDANGCLLYTSPSPRDATLSRMPSSA